MRAVSSSPHGLYMDRALFATCQLPRTFVDIFGLYNILPTFLEFKVLGNILGRLHSSSSLFEPQCCCHTRTNKGASAVRRPVTTSPLSPTTCPFPSSYHRFLLLFSMEKIGYIPDFFPISLWPCRSTPSMDLRTGVGDLRHEPQTHYAFLPGSEYMILTRGKEIE